ncbi:nose resistant to fluoxetine protein 6-like isoform X2 [Dermacentor albipictus]|uniref:nose resistant to fluoxetine protein 6-like isoform X2 n=1 Tax=Dermacentor albipictus TaxID=60249 RepID=UPI0038FC864F
MFESWESPILSAGFVAVDTFFFMSGYLLYYVLNKQNQNRAVVAVIALLRRFIRGTIPMFFMIMCIYLLPLIASGPNSKEFYDRFYTEVRDHWWHLLVQIRNWRSQDFDVATMAHLWYLSVDYQLFIVALVVIQTFRRKKWLVAFIFAGLSLLCCGIASWEIYGTHMLPFIVSLYPSYKVVLDTTTYYYELPFYHAVCFFSGCITFTLVEQYGKAKISKMIQALLWCTALFCGLCCLFMKLAWNRSEERRTETIRMFAAFSDRILWSICMAWFSFACITGRGGIVNGFLSWKGFAPLGRLSFGVYLIHVPFYHVMNRISRERRFYSHFTMVSNCFVVLTWSYILSYILSIACELPFAHLEKLVFMRGFRKDNGATENWQKRDHDEREDAKDTPVIAINSKLTKGTTCI